MKNFLARLTCFAMIQVAIAIVVLPFGKSDEYLLAMSDKHALLTQKTNRPRLILVGGSSVAFGIDSHFIRQQLKMQPINLGLHDRAGLEFQLRMVEAHIRSGDVVVLLPEYSLLSHPGFSGRGHHKTRLLEQWPLAATYYEKTAAADREIWSWKYFLDTEGLAVLAERSHWGRKNLSRRLRGKRKVYVRSGFNQYGDMIAHYDLPTRGYPGPSGEAPTESFVDLDVIKEINDFAERCAEQGGKVFFSFPPHPVEVFNRHAHAIARTNNDLGRLLRVEIIGTPGDFCFDSHLFFDAVYHLTQRGARIRSDRLAKGLAQAVSKEADNEIATGNRIRLR